MRFSEAVDLLYEKKVQPLKPVEFKRQMIAWIEKYWGVEHVDRSPLDTEDVTFQIRLNRNGSVELEYDDIGVGFEESVIAEAKKRGWFLMVGSDRFGKQLTFFPNYTEKIERDELPRYLYRATAWKYNQQIQREGFKPRDTYSRDIGGDANNPPPARVYLFVDEGTLYDTIGTIAAGRKRQTRDYSIWRVDTRALGKGVNFHMDTEYGMNRLEAVWTYSHIPPQAIEYMGHA